MAEWQDQERREQVSADLTPGFEVTYSTPMMSKRSFDPSTMKFEPSDVTYGTAATSEGSKTLVAAAAAMNAFITDLSQKNQPRMKGRLEETNVGVLASHSVSITKKM
jgi:hypothetical protein